MVTNEHLQIPEYESARAESIAFVESVANAPSMQDMAKTFGVEFPNDFAGLDVTQKLSRIKEFSNEYLNVRALTAKLLNKKTVERSEVSGVTYTSEQAAAINVFKHEFAMEGESDAKEMNPDAIQILGARADSIDANRNLKQGAVSLRIDKLKRELDRGVKTPYIFLLGSARPLAADEKLANLGAKTEFDAMNLAFEKQFGVEPNVESTFDLRDSKHNQSDPESWKIRYYEMPDGTKVFSVSAPKVEGDLRANTADTYKFIRRLVDDEMLSARRILNVTTDLYIPFQHADALRLLGIPMNLQVESVGYGGVARATQAYAGEINSLVNQAVLLHQSLEAA